eukprot:m.69291 g.69291  ORF g.69291 m.69291 type:complete len:76 (+) comp24074_c0_seq1:377-604(+)
MCVLTLMNIILIFVIFILSSFFLIFVPDYRRPTITCIPFTPTDATTVLEMTRFEASKKPKKKKTQKNMIQHQLLQ